MVEPPKKLRPGHRRCQQTLCGYFINGECKACDECKARPYEINSSCMRCIACVSKPNELRWGDPYQKGNEIQQLNKESQINAIKAIMNHLNNTIEEMEKDQEEEMKIQR